MLFPTARIRAAFDLVFWGFQMNMHINPVLANAAGPLPKIAVSAFDKCEPLPAGFGSINPNDAFDAGRFFTAARCNGWGQTVQRYEGKVYFGQRAHPFDLQTDRTKLQRRRYTALRAWSDANDPDHALRNAYIAAIVEKMPNGDFYHTLG
jgi:hypothetical protein